jgi:NAD(P)H-hydrate epimerase
MDSMLTLPPIPLNANKYLRGSLLMLAGSRRYFGAAVLATLAAEKSGVGYVSLATPKSNAAAARQHLLCSPIIEAPEEHERGSFSATALSTIANEVHAVDAICCGPGLTVTDATREFVGQVITYATAQNIPLLLDADALNVVSKSSRPLEGRFAKQGEHGPLILTPHAGELKRLFVSRGIDENEFSEEEFETDSEIDFEMRAVPDERATARLAQELDAIIVAKGPTTLITDGTRHTLSSEASPALAKAGTGDVLAGVISGLLAQGISAMDAAILGVRIHSRAGMLAEQKQGCRSVTALDVIEALPAAVREFEATVFAATSP